MSSTTAAPAYATSSPDARSTIALTDEHGAIMIALPYTGDDPHGALATLLARWQGFGSCIIGGSVFDREGATLATAQI